MAFCFYQLNGKQKTWNDNSVWGTLGGDCDSADRYGGGNKNWTHQQRSTPVKDSNTPTAVISERCSVLLLDSIWFNLLSLHISQIQSNEMQIAGGVIKTHPQTRVSAYLRIAGLVRVWDGRFLSWRWRGSLETSLQMFLAVKVSHSMVDKEA